MWALIYKLNEVILKEESIEEMRNETNIIEAHLFDKTKDIYFDKDMKETHLENSIKEKDAKNYFDEEMFISKVYSKIYKSNYNEKNKIVIRNYIDYNEDGILYISSSRLLEVK